MVLSLSLLRWFDDRLGSRRFEAVFGCLWLWYPDFVWLRVCAGTIEWWQVGKEQNVAGIQDVYR
ncbi:MAG: hypothetical protein ACJA1F_001647 [Paracoccaceae bacterium]|jgi:hypothetical protein|tara:strand:- start:27 stop:218 length:192 start_codon:yes stop_codon:yes gene_type:complete